MNYEKPNITLVASAAEAVTSQTHKDDVLVPDSSQMFVTSAAYEADE